MSINKGCVYERVCPYTNSSRNYMHHCLFVCDSCAKRISCIANKGCYRPCMIGRTSNWRSKEEL